MIGLWFALGLALGVLLGRVSLRKEVWRWEALAQQRLDALQQERLAARRKELLEHPATPHEVKLTAGVRTQ